ncbi:hypothetical protein WA026_000296 [Henosepilachna vigintioctopunctata]|uniref:SET domain-containing protein n=1 Tax=Henosepilachna vigintioctopunctata TaxID=420089 RepID=A0AAW1UX60_9CUCU
MDKNIYEVLHNQTYGRYVTAKRCIKQGELIWNEKPLIVGSQIGGGIICFKCCVFISKTQCLICDKCRTAFICDLHCSGEFHNTKECEELSKLALDSDFLKYNNNLITPLRLLLLRNYSQNIWQEIMKLEAHVESRRGTPIWDTNKILVEDVLKDTGLLLDEDITNETIQKICGLLDVNTFEIRPPQNRCQEISKSESQCLRGLYLKTALMSHACVSNTHLTVDDNFLLRVHASTDIKEGHPIVFNYANVLDGTQVRKKHLKYGKHFECNCKRCLDPSELNTNISSLKCHKCKTGIILPEVFNSTNNNWCCKSCGKVFKNCLIETVLRQVDNLIEDTDQTNLFKLEELYGKLLKTLHPHHYLILALQQKLVGLYTQSIQNKKNLSRKNELCQNLIKVYEILEPGISRNQGVIQYELHSTIANLAYKEYSLGEITLETLLQQLFLAEATLKAALKHLIYEPKKSPEGRIVQEALGYLKDLRQSISDIKEQITSRTLCTKTKKKRNHK